MEGLTAFCGLTFIPRFQTSVTIVRMCVHYHYVSHRYPWVPLQPFSLTTFGEKVEEMRFEFGDIKRFS